MCLHCVRVVLPVKHELLLKVQEAHIYAWVQQRSALKMGSSKKSAKGRLDKYYHLAKDQGYRARSAFKLVHLNKKYDFLSKAKVVVDLCAAPGGWLQVSTKFMPKSHVLVGVDLVPIKPIPGVITLTGDITTEKCRVDIQRELKNWKADVVLHDGAPNVGKAWIQDAFSQSELVLSAFKLACSLLSPKGLFITKIFRSKEYNSLLWIFNQLFDKVEATKPPSSRSVSAEIFVVCQGYKAPPSVDPKFFDPKFVFDDVEEPSGTSGASTVKKLLEGHYKQDRSRSGYEENKTALYKEKMVSEFITSTDPIAFLDDTNRIVIDEESECIKLILAQGLLNPEVRESFQDIKVLGRKELKMLISWRKKCAKAIDSCKNNDQSGPVDKEIITDNLAERETASDKLSMEAQKIVKSEKKKMLEKKAKSRMRMQLQMDTTHDIDDPYDISEFTGPVMKRSKPVDHNSDVSKDALEKKADTDVWFSNPLFKKLGDAPVPKAKITRAKETVEDAIVMVPKEDGPVLEHEDREVLTSHRGIDIALNFAETSKRRRSRMIDESYNRYTFGDSTSLPDWFRRTRISIIVLCPRIKRGDANDS